MDKENLQLVFPKYWHIHLVVQTKNTLEFPPRKNTTKIPVRDCAEGA